MALSIFALNSPSGSLELHKDDIQKWADLISEELAQLAKKGLEYEEIQNIYDKAQYTTEYINGTSKVLELREKLGKFHWYYTGLHQQKVYISLGSSVQCVCTKLQCYQIIKFNSYK